MADESAVAPTSTSGFDIECSGKTWTIGRPTRAAKDVLGKLIVQSAWSRVEELREYLPQAYQESKDELVRQIGAGDFKPGGKCWMSAFNGPDGNTLFLLSLLKDKHPAATPDDARKLLAESADSVTVALAVLVPDFFDLLAALPDTPGEMRERFREGAAKYRASR